MRRPQRSSSSVACTQFCASTNRARGRNSGDTNQPSAAPLARYSMGRAAQAQIAAFLEDSGSNPDRFEIVVNKASPLAAITRAVERSDPDLSIVGTRGPGLLRRLFLSSIASSVLREI